MTLNQNDVFDIVRSAAGRYSYEMYSSKAYYKIENILLNAIETNDTQILSFFKNYELKAMKELVSNNKWIEYHPEANDYYVTRNWDNMVNGAD